MKKNFEEVWRRLDFIEGLEGYEISNLGRVKSFRQNKRTGRILAASLVSAGDAASCYWAIPIWRDGHEKLYYIHYLVARAFCDGYEEGKVVHHISGCRQDNTPENLIWVTPSQHMKIHARQRQN